MFEHGANKQQQSSGRAASLAEMRGRVGSRMNRNSSGDSLKNYMEALRAQLNERNLADQFKLVAVDRTQAGLRISSILVYATEGDTTAVSTLLLEATCSPLRPTKYDNHIELPRPVGSLYNNELIEENLNYLCRQTKLDIENCVTVSGMVIPSTMNPLEDVAEVRDVMFAAINSIENLFNDGDPDAARWDISALDRSIVFEGHIDFSPAPYYSFTGKPVRADYMIDVIGRDGHQSSESQAYADDFVVSRAAAFLDLMYVGPGEIRDAGGYVRGTTSQVYAPRITISSVETEIAMSVEMYLQGLISTFSLGIGNADSQVWCNRFNVAHGETGIFRDLRSLSYECMPTPLDAEDGTFRPAEFLRDFVDVEPVFIVHAEDVGPASFITDLLRGAAENSEHPARNEMKRYIYESIMTLTGGRYSRPEHAPICEIEADSKIILGTWPDATNTMRDLREIDLLWVYTHFGATEWEMCLEFADTFKFNAPLEVRIAKRLELYTKMIQRQPTVDGYAVPVLLDPEFVVDSRRALAEAGGDLKFDSLTYGESRGTRDYNELRRHRVNSFAAASAAPYRNGQAMYQQPVHRRSRF